MTELERADLRAVFAGALAEVDAARLVRRAVRMRGQVLDVGAGLSMDLGAYRRVVILGCGKAALPMGDAVDEVLPESLDVSGCVVTNDATAAARRARRRFEVLEGEHPVPGRGSFAGGRQLLELARAADRPDTLVLFVVSGGASALAEVPRDGVGESELGRLHAELVRCGATIAEINAVRRVLSALKDGRLAIAAGRSRQISLLLSDVNVEDPQSLGSGPTVAPRRNSRAAASEVLRRYGIGDSLSPAARAVLASPASSMGVEREFDAVVVGDNRTAVEAAARVGRSLGYDVVADTAADPEPTVEILARRLATPLGRVQLRVTGGEAVCPVRGDGRGGRSLETALRVAIELDRTRDPILVLVAGTDGIDGNSPAAGALADRDTVSRARALGFDAAKRLGNSDAFPLFEALGDAIMTGPTGTNVRDLHLCLEFEAGR